MGQGRSLLDDPCVITDHGLGEVAHPGVRGLLEGLLGGGDVDLVRGHGDVGDGRIIQVLGRETWRGERERQQGQE